MTLSGTWNWGTTTGADDILSEAFERIGMDPGHVSAWQMESARRSAQMVFSDWSNRPVNLWKVNQYTVALIANQQSFNLLPQQLFITEAATRTTSGGVNNDLIISPISRAEYLAQPNKAQAGSRPTQFYLQRSITPTVFLWPTPQDATVSILYNSMDFQQDVGSFANTLDAPQRWFEALAAGIAYRLAQKYAPTRLQDTKAAYDEAYSAAAAEDTENVPLRIVPDMRGRR